MKAATHFMRQIEQYRRAHAEWQAHGLCKGTCVALHSLTNQSLSWKLSKMSSPARSASSTC